MAYCVRQSAFACPAPHCFCGAFGLFTPVIEPAIFRLTFLLAVGDYPVQGETKQCWIELCSEAAICDDPQRMDDLAEAITAPLDEEKQEEKQRLHAVPRTVP